MTAEGVYAALLRLYPSSFREAYGSRMVEAFRDMRRDPGHRGFRFWLWVLDDLSRSLIAQYLERLHIRGNQPAVQWSIACGLGAFATTVLAFALAWPFAYLYHPYLEGATFVPWIYGAILGVGLGVIQVAVLRALRLGLVWIGVTALCAAFGLELGRVCFGAACDLRHIDLDRAWSGQSHSRIGSGDHWSSDGKAPVFHLVESALRDLSC